MHPAHFPDSLECNDPYSSSAVAWPRCGNVELHETGRGRLLYQFDAGFQLDEGNRALRYLWARSRVAELSDYGSRNVSAERVKDITSLGLKYNLLTQYTSFIAVLEEVRNPLGPAQNVNQPLPLPLGVSDLAIGEGTEVGSEPELVWLITAALGLALVLIVRGRCRRSLFYHQQ